MDRYRFKERLKTIGYVMVWIALVLFSIRQGVLLWKTTQPVPKAQVKAEVQEVPNAAATTGRKFLINWFYATNDETPSDKVKRMEKYMTSRLADRLKSDSRLLIKLEPGEKRKTIQAHTIDHWESKWVEKGKRAKVTYNVVLEDGRDVYMEVPVIRSGTWVVDGLPALVPEPQRKELAEEETMEVEKSVTAVVDGFFSAWLAGKTEAISRYSKFDLRTADALKKMKGQYEEVTVEGLSERPLKVKAVVKVQDVYGQTHFFEYHLTMKKDDNQWYITGME